jgi:hypothetical protein
MNTTSRHAVTLGMLLWEAEAHKKNGRKQEASKIKQWVAELLNFSRGTGLQQRQSPIQPRNDKMQTK